MNDVSWFIQTNLIAEDQVREVWTAALDSGARPVEAIVTPFVDEVPCPSDMGTNVIPYGSTKLTRLATQMNWKGVFFDHDAFSMRSAIQNRDDMLNRNAVFTTVGEMKDFDGHDHDVFFIRPVHDLKSFNGTVTTGQEIRRWMQSVDSGNFSFDDSTEVLISEPVQLLNEARYFVVGGKIIDGSYYRFHGQRISSKVSPDIIDKMQAFVDSKWLPNAVCVMDIALTMDGYKVIEFNSFNSSGFYAHDIRKIVGAVTNHVATLM